MHPAEGLCLALHCARRLPIPPPITPPTPAGVPWILGTTQGPIWSVAGSSQLMERATPTPPAPGTALTSSPDGQDRMEWHVAIAGSFRRSLMQTASIHIFAENRRHDDRFHVHTPICLPEAGQQAGSPFRRCKLWLCEICEIGCAAEPAMLVGNAWGDMLWKCMLVLASPEAGRQQVSPLGLVSSVSAPCPCAPPRAAT